MEITAFDLAQRFVGIAEAPGLASSPQVLAMLRLDAAWPEGDHVPWCSAFVNYVAWLLRLPRSKSLAARSWLRIGRAVAIGDAVAAFDIVVLRRSAGKQPGADVLDAPGHVGFFAGLENDRVLLLGGNQHDGVTVERFPSRLVLGVRRLA